MQSLRGLGASAELSPLPELLDAMEVATRTLLADVPAPPNVASVFADAAHALAAMARSVADAGQITPPPELESVAQRLLESYATESDVVPIAALAPAGVESIVQRGTPPSAMPEADPVPVELVSVGDHLLLVADALARPASPAARDLALRAASHPRGDAVAQRHRSLPDTARRTRSPRRSVTMSLPSARMRSWRCCAAADDSSSKPAACMTGSRW